MQPQMQPQQHKHRTTHTINQATMIAESVLQSPKIGGPTPVQLLPELKGLKLGASKHNGAEAKSTGETEKRGDTIIFVGDLSRTVKDKDLRTVMENHGTVINVDIKRDRVTNNNLGYGFVQFETHEQAVKAKKAMHGVEVAGRKIRTGWAQRNTTLFVGDLDNFVEESTYRAAFSKFGGLVDDETYFKVEKGFGMVKFQTRENAEAAKLELNGKKIGNSKRPVRVIWGDTSVQKHCVHVKFDSGVKQDAKSPNEGDITEDILKTVFSEYGKVVSVNLPRHNDQRLKGYGFVHFEDTEEGEECAKKSIKNLSGSKVDGIVIQCNYGRKHSKRRNRNGNIGGGGGGGNNSRTGHGQMYMYQYAPQGGTYPMMYPMQTPYMYQQQVPQRGRPGPIYSPYGFQQMGYYQYGQGGQTNGGSPAQGSPQDLGEHLGGHGHISDYAHGHGISSTPTTHSHSLNSAPHQTHHGVTSVVGPGGYDNSPHLHGHAGPVQGHMSLHGSHDAMSGRLHQR
mmetsp:Transcript_20151/g.49409  ORF Transcript_20151/g.49409 Transcript_20151/m.49409 type:complete len:508 (-) Transcript_20151:269-1792(-)